MNTERACETCYYFNAAGVGTCDWMVTHILDAAKVPFWLLGPNGHKESVVLSAFANQDNGNPPGNIDVMPNDGSTCHTWRPVQ